MKTTVVSKRYEEVVALPKEKRFKPMKQSMFFRVLLKVASAFDLAATHFKCNKIGMEQLKPNEPCLVLMNHSSFIDLEIVASVLFPRKFNIVATNDSFMGIMKWLMRLIGCIPTSKFVTDTTLIRDMIYCVNELKSSVVMYPEASYSFDGTATPLPDSIGRFVKMLGVPVVMIRTYGAFARQPLYNCLRKRKVQVTADMKYVLSAEDVAVKSADEINDIINTEFDFDNFKWQQENKISIPDAERAEGLNRVLYKCPHCMAESKMVGKGTTLTCEHCDKQYELTEYGYLQATEGDTKFEHVPDWYCWERECVRQEILDNTYELKVPVDICMMVDMKKIYRVGEGTLEHNKEGFHLTGCDGKLDYSQKPTASYSLYADYYWYEIGDVICIGDNKVSYYCFPKSEGDVVAKTRLATEEMYKIEKESRKRG
ncbi:MAG: 1-acyl-sn-glycerol-3-phosphate acyltransferase [Tyzzerella sp.]|nr:1-acyl-sn-glycerol-3-phosphate acyltransferase [Tyzzerella sp.]